MVVVLAVLHQVDDYWNQKNVDDKQIIANPDDQHQVTEVPPGQIKFVVLSVFVSLSVPDHGASENLQGDVENVYWISNLFAIFFKIEKCELVLPPVDSIAVLQQINVHEAQNVAEDLASIKVKID